MMEQHKIPKDHICFSMNRHELLLSMALLAAGIPHQREVAFYKNYRCDFLFPPTKLMVELDGEYHSEHKQTWERDARKDVEVKRLGYSVLRFPNKMVERNCPEVIRQIKDALASLPSYH